MAATMQWSTFAATPDGTRIWNHGADECVALVNRHNEEVLGGTFVAVGSARQWWQNFSLMDALNGTFRQSQTPVAGAVAVWKPSAANGWHGHIGSVLSVNQDGSFVTLEQNYGTGAKRWAHRYTRRKDDSLYGFLVPINNPAVSEKEDEDMKVVGYIRDKAKGSQGSVYALQENGRKRLIPSAEWNALRAIEGQGVKLPVALVAAGDLSKIPAA